MIQPSTEGAVGWAYILQIDSSGGDSQGGAGARSSVTEGGLYHDVIVKTADGWRFKKRTYIGGHGMPERAQSALIPIEAVRARPGGTRPGPLTALDYTEIKRLVGQYNLGYDSTAATDDGAMVGLAFTPDAFFERAGSDNPWRGRQAIVDASARPRLGIHHWVSNLLIDPTPDGAASWSYLLLFTVNDDGTVVRERGGGILHETYTRTAEGWQIKYRRYDALGSTTAIGWPSPQFGHFVDALAPEPAPDDTMLPHLSSRDHVEIEQLYIRNNIAFDSVADGGQAFARTFTLDGALVAPTGTVTGHERLAARAAQHTPGLHTWMSNLIIEASSEGATGSVYILTADMTGTGDSGRGRGRRSLTGRARQDGGGMALQAANVHSQHGGPDPGVVCGETLRTVLGRSERYAHITLGPMFGGGRGHDGHHGHDGYDSRPVRRRSAAATGWLVYGGSSRHGEGCLQRALRGVPS